MYGGFSILARSTVVFVAVLTDYCTTIIWKEEFLKLGET
jgi:hypothetical protein